MTLKKEKDIVEKKGTKSSSSTITELLKTDTNESREIRDWLFPL